ncbi:MAG: hypothetical protein JNM84_07545 [Planctomycetes bacterium]|nr:hypothetical protein [Planctomycetota bacterium]
MLCATSPLRALSASLLAFGLAASASAQVTASYTLGAPGCNGSTPSHCLTLNDVNPVNQVSSLPNEYAYPVINTTAVAIQVAGFEIFTQSNTGNLERGITGLCLDNSGPNATVHTQPAAAFYAQGTIEVGGTAGWYSTTVVPPLVVLPGEVFWFTCEAFARIAPPQHVTTGGVNGPVNNWYRRPTLSANAWTRSVSVARQIFRIRCVTNAPAVPYVSASGAPVLGQPFTLTLGGGLPSSLGFLVFSSDDTNWYGFATPFDLTPFGAPTCTVGCTWENVLTLGLDAQGQVAVSGTIPNFPAFNGVRFFNQGLVFAPGVNAINLLISNLGTGVIGS